MLFAGCNTTRQIVMPEKQTIIRQDSVITHRTDSVIIRTRLDTVFVEKYMFVDKFKFVKDTVDKEVPVTVEVEKAVTPRWAWYSLGSNFLLVFILIGFAGFKIAKKIYALRK